MQALDKDAYFTGLDMTRDPAIIKPGSYSIGEHVVCQDGTIASRPGHLCVPWGDDWRFARTYEKRPIRRHDTIIDAILFRNPASGLENAIFITDEGGFLIQPGSVCEKIAWPVGFTAPTEGTLVQAFDKVYFLNDDSILVWNGDPADDFDFAGPPSGYTSAGELNGKLGCYFKNRLFIVVNENTVWASDILEPTAFNINNEFFVNQGDADEIVTIVPYTNSRVIVFKENSIYFLDNLTGDLSGAGISLVASNIGLSAKRCVSVVGQDVFWLSRRGIMKAILAYDQRLTPDTVPLSEPIEPVINRINWGYASKAWSAQIGDRLYFAVPVDDSTTNNCVLVYNLKNQAWESTDIYSDFTETWEYTAANTYTDNWGPQAMVRITYAGKDVVIAFTKLGATYLHRYNNGKKDVHIEPQTDLTTWTNAWDSAVAVDSTGYDPFIQNFQDLGTVMQTRGYLAGDLSTKRGVHFDFQMSTYDPNLTIEIVNGGPNETTTLKSGITRSSSTRLDYQNSATTTVPSVHTEKYLADYSIDLESTVQGDDYTPDQTFYFGDATYADVYLPREQEYSERFRFNKRGRAYRLKLSSPQGIIRLKSVTAREYLRNRKHRREV